MHQDRLEFLDGVRGMAASMVVVYHFPAFVLTPPLVAALALGNPWVAVFITLSGFCLYLPSARRDHAEMPRPFWEFMRRRALRILPAWYASLVLCGGVGVIFLLAGYEQPMAFLPQDLADLVTHVTLVHSMTVYSGSINGPGYTLGTEWQLYILMAPFLLIARRLGWAALLVLVAATALPIPDLAGKLIHKVFAPEFTVPFVVGIISARGALTSPSRTGLLFGNERLTVLALGGLVVTGICTFLLLSNRIIDLAYWAVSVSTGAACILMARYPSSLATRMFGSRIGQTGGSFAYSLYLTHFPLLAVVAFLATRFAVGPRDAFYFVLLPSIPILFGFAYVFYLLFERPFLRYRRRSGVVTQSPVERTDRAAGLALSGSSSGS